jgi:MFS family permease
LKVFQTFSPQLRHNLLTLFTAGLLFWSSMASLLPVLPLYVESVSPDKHTVGIVMGCFAIGLLGARSFLSKLADARGRKMVLLIGVVVAAIAPTGYVFITNVYYLMALRAFHGISIAAFALAYSALVVDLSPVKQRGEVIGYMSLVNPVGMAMGPAIGGFLQSSAGFAPVFWMCSGLAAIGLICTTQIEEQQTDPSSTLGKHVQQPNRDQFWSLLADPRVRIPALTLLMVGLAFGILTTFLPLFIRESRIQMNVGLFYSAAAIASFLIRLVAGRASDRWGRGVFISLSLLLYAASMFCISQATTPQLFIVAGLLEGAGLGTMIPILSAMMADRSHPDERGKTFGITMTGFDLGIALAGPGLGAIAQQLGYRGLFELGSGLVLLSLLIFMTQDGKDLLASLRFATGQGRDTRAI